MRKLSFKLGPFVVQASIGRPPDPALAAYGRKLDLGYARAMEARFPELREFELPLSEGAATEIAAFYAAYLPLRYEPARSAALRSMLQRLRDSVSDAAVKRAASVAIAKSDLEDGLAERGLIIRHLQEWQDEARHWEAAYGSPIISTDWKGADRAASVRLYFENNKHLLQGKDVLHIAPEPVLAQWLRSAESGIKSYVSADAQFDATERHDITNLGFSSSSFDLIICHRVMEHVLDDAAGFAEMHRVLRPGGLVNFSVPQMPQKERTKEWVVPDTSHDGHVRQYGADLVDRMAAAGFRVDYEPWLLKQPENDLRKVNAYPMRMFNLRKQAA
jgi:hypothetical protein